MMTDQQAAVLEVLQRHSGGVSSPEVVNQLNGQIGAKWYVYFWIDSLRDEGWIRTQTFTCCDSGAFGFRHHITEQGRAALLRFEVDRVRMSLITSEAPKWLEEFEDM